MEELRNQEYRRELWSVVDLRMLDKVLFEFDQLQHTLDTSMNSRKMNELNDPRAKVFCSTFFTSLRDIVSVQC